MKLEEKLSEIRELFRSIKYPGSSKNIIELDMVQNIRIDEAHLSFRLVFQNSKEPFVGSIQKKCKALLSEYKEGVFKTIDIETIFIQELQRPLSLNNVNNIIAISSGKGGVGKSTVSANLAVALAGAGYKVGLLDADIYGPSMPKMFNCEDARPYMDMVDGREMIIPIESYGVKLLSIGFFVESGSATVWRGAMASNALKQLLEQGYWGDLDYLLIDLPPGTSDIHLTLVQTLALTGAIVVSTPQQVALADAIKGINMFESAGIGVPILGLVENMSWFTPAELPENKYYLFGKDGVKKLAEERGMQLLGQIPIVQSICESGDGGEPIALNRESIVGLAFVSLAEKLIAYLMNGDVPIAHRVVVGKK